METDKVTLIMILLYVTITCPLPFLFGRNIPSLLIVGAIIWLIGIPLALVLSDPTLLMATIFSSIEVFATIVYPFVWYALGGTSPDFSVLFVLLTVGWWLYLYLVGWRKRKEQ